MQTDQYLRTSNSSQTIEPGSPAQFRSSSVTEKTGTVKNPSQRRLTTGSLYHTTRHVSSQMSTKPSASPKRSLDPLSSLLGMAEPTEADRYGSPQMDGASHGGSRGRRVKRFQHSAPFNGVTSGNTTLGPLQEKHKLNPLERVFLEAAERGDRSTLARCLQFKEKVNVNCVNMLGRTAIQIAVDNENMELVELLLQEPGIKIGDALLYAIQEGVYRIVEMLIDHPSITKQMLGTSWHHRDTTKVKRRLATAADDDSGDEEESHDFSADISPVNLAAVCNQFEILQLLLNRGARIEEPHKSSCGCVHCGRLLAEDPLKHTLQRINTYRALASPAWISLTSSDPVLTAFKLSSELLHLASSENEFKEIFISLCEQCRKYACDLLDLCRGTGEVVAIMGRSDNSDSDSDSSDDEEYFTNCIRGSRTLGGMTGESVDSPGQCEESGTGSVTVGIPPGTVEDPLDWRSLVNRPSNGARKRHASSRYGVQHHASSHTGPRLNQGLSLESQHTVVDDLPDETVVQSEGQYSTPQAGRDQTTVKDSQLSVPRTTAVSSIARRTDDARDPVKIVVSTSNQIHHRRMDTSSDDGVIRESGRPDLGHSSLFSEPRRGSFDHESTNPPKETWVNNRSETARSWSCCHSCLSDSNGPCGEPSCSKGNRGNANQCTNVAKKKVVVEKRQEFTAFKLDRLKLAIKYEQKKFVAHPHCQHLLTTLWYDQLPGWRKRYPFTKVFLCFCVIVAMPIMAPIYLLYPHGRVGQLLRSPLIKFINHSASFAIFIFLLLVASMDSSTQESLRRRSEIRGPDPNNIEIFILWWVMGFVWSEMKQIWEEGFKAYVRQWWNWLDFLMLGLYLTTVSLRLVAVILRKTNQYGTEPAPRTEWPAADPTLLSEAFFSMAHIFSFARIIFLFQVNEHLGPLQISLGNMLIDITKFIFIFLLVISSFACGLHQLYYYYVSFDEDFRPIAFSSLVSSYRTLFWHLFGSSQVGHFEVRTKNATTGEPEGVMPSARNTVIVGEILLLVYHAMAIIVLVNMLIAMMSNSFQTIQNHADTEWKFARSKLWVGYFDEGSTLPPPLNTIVSPKSIFRGVHGFYRLLYDISRTICQQRPSLQSRPMATSATVAAARIAWDHCGPQTRDSMRVPPTWPGPMIAQRSTTDEESATAEAGSPVKQIPGNMAQPNTRQTFYETVMRRLVRRYIHQSKKTMRQDGVNEDDLLEIKQDISSLRYELREDRKREVARTIGHLEGLKRDLVEDIANHFGQMEQMFNTRIVPKLSESLSSQRDPLWPDETHCPRSSMAAESSNTLKPNFSEPDGLHSEHHLSGGSDLLMPSTMEELKRTGSDKAARTFSLTYGRETQHIYDEIKQLALMNTTFEAQPIRGDSILPPHTYAQLKHDILLGIRTEFRSIFSHESTPPPYGQGDVNRCDKPNVSSSMKKRTLSPCPTVTITPSTSASRPPTGDPVMERLFTPPRPLLRQARRSISPASEPMHMSHSVEHEARHRSRTSPDNVTEGGGS